MKWKKFLKKIAFPPVWLMAVLTIISAAAIIIVFVKDLSETIPAYISYVMAFYTLSVVTVYCSVVLPKQYKKIRERMYENRIINRYITDAEFKTHISLYTSLGVNLIYVAVNILSWFLYRSMWFVVLAVYYVILSVMRFLLVRYVRINKIGQNRLGELKRARLCSYILLLLNFVLTGAVMMILYQNKGFDYHGILIYVMALYTFYITIHAIINLFKYRKYNSPVMTTAKIISLSAALVSMLSLETAMFSQFGGEMAAGEQQLMIALTGAGVSIAVIILSLYMIIRSTKEIKEIKINGRNNRHF